MIRFCCSIIFCTYFNILLKNDFRFSDIFFFYYFHFSHFFKCKIFVVCLHLLVISISHANFVKYCKFFSLVYIFSSLQFQLMIIDLFLYCMRSFRSGNRLIIDNFLTHKFYSLRKKKCLYWLDSSFPLHVNNEIAFMHACWQYLLHLSRIYFNDSHHKLLRATIILSFIEFRF